MTDETVLYSDRELAREVCALFDEAHGGTPMAVLADRIARRIAEFRRACIAAPVERAERAERERDALIAAWPATGRLGVDEIVDHPDAGKWLLNRENYSGKKTRLFGTKLQAILAAAGLDAKEPTDAD